VKFKFQRLSNQVTAVLAVVVLTSTAVVGSVIVWSESRRDEQDVLDTARAVAAGLSQLCGTTLEAGVDGGYLTTGDLFDGRLDLIPGANTVDGTGKLEEKHYHRGYDWYTDRVWVRPFDAALASSPDFMYTICNDADGYIPTSNSVSMQPPGKGPFRAKRWDELRTPMHLAAAHSLEPYLVQPYLREGRWAWDVSVPISVKGRHWGAARVGVSQDRISERRWRLALALAGMLLAAGALTIEVGRRVVRRATTPLSDLAATAHAVSVGEDKEEDAVPGLDRTDEVGQMSRSVRRLRISMRAAMRRIDGDGV